MDAFPRFLAQGSDQGVILVTGLWGSKMSPTCVSGIWGL